MSQESAHHHHDHGDSCHGPHYWDEARGIWTHEAPPPVVKGDKIGRNDLCPCGSGKKYKKCCINAASA